MEELINDYKRKVDMLTNLLKAGGDGVTTCRLGTKIHCYKTFITELERALAEKPSTSQEQLATPEVIKSVCEHHYITAADWKSQTCSKCGHRINIEQTVL